MMSAALEVRKLKQREAMVRRPLERLQACGDDLDELCVRLASI